MLVWYRHLVLDCHSTAGLVKGVGSAGSGMLKKMSEAACFRGARQVAVASWGEREGSLKQM